MDIDGGGLRAVFSERGVCLISAPSYNISDFLHRIDHQSNFMRSNQLLKHQQCTGTNALRSEKVVQISNHKDYDDIFAVAVSEGH